MNYIYTISLVSFSEETIQFIKKIFFFSFYLNESYHSWSHLHCLFVTDTHSFKKMEFQPAEAKKFFSTVRKEMALLATSLPDGIMVKTFEDRMVGLWSSTWLSSELVFVYKALVTILNHFLNTNYLSLWNYLYIFLSHIQDLFSAQIKGPTRTPYEDGLFLFDIQLPNIYPAVPPLFRYLSQCSGRLNPNLYDNGKVCVSLLGTWIGKVSWVWSDWLQCNNAPVE